MDPQQPTPALPPGVSFPSGPAAPCPACGARSTQLLYALQAIPIQSCVMLHDADSARGFPCGDLRLAICQRCAFVFNEAFDPARVDYREDYEETQGFSGTFRAFLSATIERLIAEWQPAGQTLLEIGCGRGDFLEQFCAAADAWGIGIDPSRTAGRVDHNAGRGLRFLQEEYGPPHHALPVDGIACRHTLEHIAPVRTLVESIAAHLGPNPQRWTFFEVPDVERILEAGAFWDVYYEHCSYFSKASLARLFQNAGFRIRRLETVYGDQYLHLSAHPGREPAGDDLPVEPTETVIGAAESFAARCAQSLAQWHAWLQASAPGSVALWGSGSKATAFLTTLGSWDRVDCVVDINTDKQGRYCAGSGHPIVAPQQLVGRSIERLLIMNPIYVEEIQRDLAALGLYPEVRALQ